MKNNQKGFSTLVGLLLFIVLAGGGLYLYSEKTSKEMPEVNSVSMATQKETNSVSTPKKETPLKEKDTNATEDTLSYELEDGEHFVFVKDFGVENSEPFLVFDKIQANLNDPNNFPLFSNDNPLKRKLFLSRGSAYLGTADQIKEDYWNKRSISGLGGQELFELGNQQNNINNFIDKNEILVITVSKNKIWSIRYTNLGLGLNTADSGLKLKDGSYGGFYVNFFKNDGVYYLTLDIEKDDAVSLRVDENILIKIFGFGLDTEKNTTVEKFENIAYDFERSYYTVSVEVKNNVIKDIRFFIKP